MPDQNNPIDKVFSPSAAREALRAVLTDDSVASATKERVRAALSEDKVVSGAHPFAIFCFDVLGNVPAGLLEAVRSTAPGAFALRGKS